MKRQNLRQLFALHFNEIDAFPGQSAPFDGTGESHFLIFVLRPPPHVRLHELKGLQRPQPPFTTLSRENHIQIPSIYNKQLIKYTVYVILLNLLETIKLAYRDLAWLLQMWYLQEWWR